MKICHTKTFSHVSLRDDPHRTLIAVAESLEKILPEAYKGKYINQIDMIQNPDGIKFKFVIAMPDIDDEPSFEYPLSYPD